MQTVVVLQRQAQTRRRTHEERAELDELDVSRRLARDEVGVAIDGLRGQSSAHSGGRHFGDAISEVSRRQLLVEELARANRAVKLEAHPRRPDVLGHAAEV